MAKRQFKHFRDRDAPTEWVKSLDACSFTKIVKKEFNKLNQLLLWEEEDQEESVITK